MVFYTKVQFRNVVHRLVFRTDQNHAENGCFRPRASKWRSTNAVVPIFACLSRWNLRCALLSVRRSCSLEAVGAEI